MIKVVDLDEKKKQDDDGFQEYKMLKLTTEAFAEANGKVRYWKTKYYKLKEELMDILSKEDDNE